MKCSQCQHENRAGAKFCEECAAPLVRTCGHCGGELSPTAKFCPECAHPTGLVSTAPTTQRFASPESYTPKHLAERILNSKAAIEGERKQVTVLFADLKGSMELLAERDPEEARQLLDPVIERMMEAVHRYEGTVNQVMGDGIMALFGAPLAHEDHAVRACYAALRMQDAIKRYSEDVRRQGGIPIAIRVGVNSGEVVVRSIGSDLHVDYTAVGQTTHLAARMEQAALPGSIMLPASTLRLIEGYVQVRPVGPISIKGLPDPVEAYEALGAGPARTRLQVAAARGLTRFVGRAREMEQLDAALGQAQAGHGQVVAVVGEPGVGKSRLFWEFTRSHRTQGWLVLESGSVSYGRATPYLPVIDLLKAYLQIDTHDESRRLREKVTGKLLTLDETLRALLPALLGLLDVHAEDWDWQALDPPQRRRHTHEAIKRLLLRESQVQPLCLVFEDLHWIDAETQAVLDGLVESLPAARILLLVNYRPEYRHDWGSKTYYGQARIDPLPEASASELLEALLGSDPSLGALKPLLIARTEGNPFFLEESVRTLVETGLLAGDPGRYRFARPLGSIQVPATVHAVLAARIDRLPPEEKSLLQSASVIGKDVPWALLRAIADLSDDALHAQLTHLQTAEFLYQTSLFPDLEFTFKHALTHDVTYTGLLQERRRALHARLVEALERLYPPDRRAEHIERLADHAFRGESWEKAVAYLREASAKAVARATVNEAVPYLERALVALAHLPSTAMRLEAGVDIRLDLRNCLYLLGQYERTFEHLQAARELAEQAGDLARLARVTAYLGANYLFLGDYAQALAEVARARELAASARSPELEIEMRGRTAQVHLGRGEFDRARPLLVDVLRATDGGGPVPRFFGQILTSVQVRGSLALCLSEQGDFAAAIQVSNRGLAEAAREEHRYSQAVAHGSGGVVYVRKGDFGEAVPLLETALELSRSLDLWLTRASATAHLGLAYVYGGQVDAGLALLEETRKQHHALFSPIRVGAVLAEGYLVAHRPHDARSAALRAVEEARQQGAMATVARATWVIAGAASVLDAVPEASRAFRDAADVAERLGMRPLVAHCHLGLGKLYRRGDEPDQAHQHLATATAMYREMDMRFWVEQAETEMNARP